MIPQKATILCIYEILKTYSDENHILSAEKIREKLKKLYDIDMERRAIYRNIDALRSIGIEIEGYQENREGYYLVDRLFELSEIRLLCDAVASSEMIEEAAGKQIIRRLIDTQSIFQGRMLQKTLFIKPERNPQSRQLFYTIDILNVAINQGCKVSARLMELGLTHTRTEKENSPIVFIPSAMRSWVLSHLNSCEVTGPKSFREEIQQIVMEAYQAYTSIQINRSENLY